MHRGEKEQPFDPAWANEMRVIPIVKVTDRESLWHVWPSINCPTIAINYLDLRARKHLHADALDRGVKVALGFEGRCVAVLVGRNWSLNRMQTKQSVEEIETMGFDASTTMDDFVYQDDPLNYSWDRVQRAIDSAEQMIRLDPSFDIVGTVKGANECQQRFCINQLSTLGIRLMALPCSELLHEQNHRQVREFIRYTRDLRIWNWLIGIGSPALIRSFDADCSSTSKWCWSAIKGWALSTYGQKQTGHPADCGYSTCNPIRNMDSAKTLSRHNFQSLLELGLDLRSQVNLGQWT